MKKLLVTTVMLSILLSPFAKAESVRDEVPHSAGQYLDALIDHGGKQIEAGIAESKSSLAKTIDATSRTGELALLKMQLVEYQAARLITVEGKSRYVVAIVATSAIVAPTAIISANIIQNANRAFKAARFVPGIGKLAALVITAGGGMWLATETGSVIVLSPDELKTSVAYTKARIAELERKN